MTTVSGNDQRHDAASGAYVATTAVTVDDNNSGSSIGNSDGVLDAGETLELAMTFRNQRHGDGVDARRGKLRIPSPWVTVLDSTYTLVQPECAANSTTSNNQVYFSGGGEYAGRDRAAAHVRHHEWRSNTWTTSCCASCTRRRMH